MPGKRKRRRPGKVVGTGFFSVAVNVPGDGFEARIAMLEKALRRSGAPRPACGLCGRPGLPVATSLFKKVTALCSQCLIEVVKAARRISGPRTQAGLSESAKARVEAAVRAQAKRRRSRPAPGLIIPPAPRR